MWGLRTEEAVGRTFNELDIGIPVATLKPLIGNAFVDSEATGEISVDAVNRRGRNVTVRVTVSSFSGNADSISGALLLMEGAP
jgi:two-component system, chemotaxis family, CheB/CheR fusion protein